MKLYGFNILTGMAITARHFVQTYIEDFKYWFGHKERQKSFRNKPEDIGSFTVQYPEEKLKVPERFRVLPVLIYEQDSGDVRCTACGICAKVCPPQCIWIVQTKYETKPKPKVTEFFIDMDICMNCGFCSEFCPFDAIKMDHQFELSNYERKESHVYNLQDLLVSTEYYSQTHPRAWAKELAVKEEEEKKKKAKEAAAAAAAKKKAEEAAKAAAAGANPAEAAAAPKPTDAAATKTAPPAAKPADAPAAPKPVDATPAAKPAEPAAAAKPAAPAVPKPAVPSTDTAAKPADASKPQETKKDEPKKDEPKKDEVKKEDLPS
jgi:NADH-quinone oxidoreductase subunit I